MSLSGIFQVLIGFVFGIALLAASGAAAAFYFWTKLSVVPTKPVFPEERVKPSPVAKKASFAIASNSKSKSPPIPKKLPPKELPPGAYKARVTWPEGLSLRDEPNLESNRLGGVAFNQEVFVLKQSDDQRWQQVRLADGDQEGWIKAGNTEKAN